MIDRDALAVDGMPEGPMSIMRRRAGTVYWWCPGCDLVHSVPVEGENGWGFNGTLESPTLTPSVLVNGIRGISTPEWDRANPRCHSFVRDGWIQFLADCEHPLADQTVPMGPLPAHLAPGTDQ